MFTSVVLFRQTRDIPAAVCVSAGDPLFASRPPFLINRTVTHADVASVFEAIVLNLFDDYCPALWLYLVIIPRHATPRHTTPHRTAPQGNTALHSSPHHTTNATLHHITPQCTFRLCNDKILHHRRAVHGLGRLMNPCMYLSWEREVYVNLP